MATLMESNKLASGDFKRQLQGYGLTTAQILYRLPDHPSLLQTYVWQDYDLCPKFPVLNRFLTVLARNPRRAAARSVTVAHSRLHQAGRDPLGERRIRPALIADPAAAKGHAGRAWRRHLIRLSRKCGATTSRQPSRMAQQWRRLHTTVRSASRATQLRFAAGRS